jgi:hypothetical protein
MAGGTRGEERREQSAEKLKGEEGKKGTLSP